MHIGEYLYVLFIVGIVLAYVQSLESPFTRKEKVMTKKKSTEKLLHRFFSDISLRGMYNICDYFEFYNCNVSGLERICS